MDPRMNVVALRVPEPAQTPDHEEALRMAEALLFAAAEPLAADELAGRLPEGANLEAILADLAERYAARGVNLVIYAMPWLVLLAGGAVVVAAVRRWTRPEPQSSE